MKKIVKSALLLAAMSLFLVVSGCGKVAGDSGQGELSGESGHYTFRTVSEDPVSWNPLNDNNEAAEAVIACTTTPLYKITREEGQDQLGISCVLAQTKPVDVTAQFKDKTIYHIPGKAENGYVWKILLKKDAVWENGEKITAQTAADSIKRILDNREPSEMTRMLAGGSLPLASAEDYRDQGYVPVIGADKKGKDTGDQKLYVNLKVSLPYLDGASLEEYYRFYLPDKPQLFRTAKGVDFYPELEKLAVGGFTPVNAKLQKILNRLGKNMGLNVDQVYRYFCFYRKEKAGEWKKVGVVAKGQELTLIAARPLRKQEVSLALSRLVLVHPDLEKKSAEQYASSRETYDSYGPYKISSYEPGKEMTLEKNENWFGYRDPQLSKGYQTTNIDIKYLSDEKKELEEFDQGKFDRINIGTEDAGNEREIKKEDSSRSVCYRIQGDFYQLSKGEYAGVNKKILGYKDFRRGIARLYDRNAYADRFSAGGTAQYGLFNDDYQLSLNGDTYRSTSAGKQVLKAVCDPDKKLKKNGNQDLEKAAKLMMSAYNICLEDGNILETDRIEIRLKTGERDEKQECEYLQQLINAATAKTALENKITVKQPAEDEEGDICKISVDGQIYNPYQELSRYCDEKFCVTEGSYPSLEKVDFKLGGKDKADTPDHLQEKLISGNYSRESYRLVVFSELEKHLLENTLVIPLYQDTRDCIYSKRIAEGISDGGRIDLQTLTYTMDDREWAVAMRGERS